MTPKTLLLHCCWASCCGGNRLAVPTTPHSTSRSEQGRTPKTMSLCSGPHSMLQLGRRWSQSNPRPDRIAPAPHRNRQLHRPAQHRNVFESP